MMMDKEFGAIDDSPPTMESISYSLNSDFLFYFNDGVAVTEYYRLARDRQEDFIKEARAIFPDYDKALRACRKTSSKIRKEEFLETPKVIGMIGTSGKKKYAQFRVAPQKGAQTP